MFVLFVVFVFFFQAEDGIRGVAVTGVQTCALPIFTADKWQTLFSKLTAQNAGDYQGVYLQVTRGTSPVRSHRFPVDCQPTVFAYTFTDRKSVV